MEAQTSQQKTVLPSRRALTAKDIRTANQKIGLLNIENCTST